MVDYHHVGVRSAVPTVQPGGYASCGLPVRLHGASCPPPEACICAVLPAGCWRAHCLYSSQVRQYHRLTVLSMGQVLYVYSYMYAMYNYIYMLHGAGNLHTHGSSHIDVPVP